MIRITQLKLPVEHSVEELKERVARMLRKSQDEIGSVAIRRQSLDARKKPDLFYVYTVDVRLVSSDREKNTVRRAGKAQVSLCREEAYRFVKTGERPLGRRPVIIGTGPAGLFCGLMLARHGYRPLLLERGMEVEQRKEAVRLFWETGVLDVRSNVQFGEGGAGTFSDGKLNTLVKDPGGRNQLVLEIFREFGADAAILYENKPHIGTDVLSRIVKRIREEIIRLGGEVRFGCQVTGLIMEQDPVRGTIANYEQGLGAGAGQRKSGVVKGVVVNQGEKIYSDVVVLAVGHSARDTFAMLDGCGIPMSAKAFAVGLRIQHPQKMINLSQYGREMPGRPGAADYKLTWKASNGRGVYSFCMCPGGYVVDASSEPGRLAVNGMSYHDRSGMNANSALIVTVTPEDFPGRTPLSGIAFQRRLEELAFQAGAGRIPVQLYGDFKAGKTSSVLGDVEPQMKGRWHFADLHQILPPSVSQALLEGVEGFGQAIKGFDRADGVFAGVESRTSSPVRIWRDEGLESPVRGLYPCGEGAGYAGGITSAAMDGIRIAEAVAGRYKPL